MSHSSAYHDSLWETVPEQATPADARLRERFLLAGVAAERRRLGRPVAALDLGCGDGWFAAALLRAGAEVVAVDVSAEAVRRARARATPTGHGVDARVVAIDSPLPFSDASFDVVWAGETIEHVLDTAAWLSEVRRVLRRRARLLLSTPDHGPLTRLGLALSPRAFAAHFHPCADHLRFYTRRSLRELLGEFGFEEVEVTAAGGHLGARRVLLGSALRRRF
ncbi:MAG TPA: class I SAM-dependent methyltransferase [Solirubrobacteraceae bacterium]|nr:class I SAM-dependent methyltransferase [Solirubrobacteraceae bacterium]